MVKSIARKVVRTSKKRIEKHASTSKSKSTIKRISKVSKDKIVHKKRSSEHKDHKLRSCVLFSGGKDSALAVEYALKYTSVKCLIIMMSENPESYMFHTPNIRWAKMQAEAAAIPCIIQKTKGQKEDELSDLGTALRIAKQKYQIQVVVTGAIESVYQASRVQKIAGELDIDCFNPLWQKDQISILEELMQKGFEVMIIGTFGYGMDKLIGKKIDEKFIEDVKVLRDKYRINPAGEGGEFESFVLNAPYFKKALNIEKSKIIKDNSGGIILDIESLQFK